MEFNGILLKFKQKILSAYKNNKKLFFAIISLVFIIFVLLFFPINKTNTKSSEIINKINSSTDNKKYSEYIENKLEAIILKLSDVKFVDAFVVVDSSETKHYQTQTEHTKTTNGSNETIVDKEEIVFEKNGSSQTPILLSTSYPKVLKVLIVLNKVEASTKLSIKNAVAGVLNIDSSCIFILQDS